MTIALVAFYGLLAFTSLLNLLMMTRPKRLVGDVPIAVLIPARNEEENLRVLLPMLDQGRPSRTTVFVLDDDSEDATGDVAAELGARVIRLREPLPPGWTGKNRACHTLAQHAIEESDADWLLFIDADTRPKEGFHEAIQGLVGLPGQRPVVTAFPEVVPGRGVEPLFLAWVGWVLLASNPFGLVSRSRMGHNRFLNGQFQLWRTRTYADLWPNERVKDKIMEDVQMGRMLAREAVPVEVVNLSKFFRVKMYETWKETLDGMSKNSFEITGSYVGTVLVAALFLLAGFAWIAFPPALILLVLSGVFVSLTARAPVWPAFLMPIVLAIGGYTLLRSAVWRKQGRVVWKGRIYP